MSRDAGRARKLRLFAWLFLVGVALACSACSQQAAPERAPGMASPAGDPSPSPERTWTATPLAETPTATPSPSTTPSPTRTPTPTRTPRPTRTPTPTRTPSSTPTATSTPTSTPTPTPTPFPTPDGVLRVSRVPILMYHHIATPPPGADAIRRDLSVSPARFEEQLRYLKGAGYTSITLRDLIYHMALGWPLPERPVILTFDDGYRDAYTFAYPLLKKYGFVGTFFLVTAPIDQENPEYLAWEHVVRMHEGGMEFGAHSYTHPDLRGKTVDYIVWQVVGSKEAIEARIGEPVRFFAYPSGLYDQLVVDVLRSAHFWGAVLTHNTDPIRSDNLFCIPRIRIRGSDTLDSFIRKVEMGS